MWFVRNTLSETLLLDFFEHLARTLLRLPAETGRGGRLAETWQSRWW